MCYVEEIFEVNKKFIVKDETVLFKYMDFTKFMYIMEKKKLFFCNANKFEDKYEGSLVEGFYHNWSESQMIIHKELNKMFGNMNKSYISCWNKGHNESYALWKIYSNPYSGVAIKTTVGNLKEALKNSQIKIYNVNYINSFKDINEKVELPVHLDFNEIDDINLINAKYVKEVYKLKAYNYEEEVRAIYIDSSDEVGKYFDIDLEKLLNEIYISPYAPDWFEDLVRTVIQNSHYDIKEVNINKSKIELR